MGKHREIINFISKKLLKAHAIKKTDTDRIVELPKCVLVIPELVTSGCHEIPDIYALATGFFGAYTISIEVKVSRADFKKDFKKVSRHYDSVGCVKYYCCPEGLIKPDEVNDWGLIYVSNDLKKCWLVKESNNFKPNRRGEIGILFSILRREGIYNQVYKATN